MKKYIIALKEIGVRDSDLIAITNVFNQQDYENLFKGHHIDLQFKHNLELNKYSNILGDLEALQTGLAKADSIIKESKNAGIKIVTFNNKNYPSRLKEIESPPAVLYFKGKGINKIHRKALGCVGTRNITKFGINAINKLVPNLVEEGFTIVSGLAEGVDSLSHRVCLNNNGNTIAVLAHGLDTIYPKSNTELANKIIESGGVLISEYPIGTKADKFRFVQRNRLISGLSEGIIVFECSEHSGTMHTVRFAQQQDRKVFCPQPSSVTSDMQGLIHILENLNGISIPTTNSYDVVVHSLGYTLKNKEKLRKIKAKNASRLISEATVMPESIYEYMIGEDSCTASTKVNREVYAKYREFLKENHLTNKDVFNAFILSIVNKI